VDTTVLAAVLAAALMHAGWNAVVKVGVDRFSSILLLALVQSRLSVLLLPAFPAPAAASWLWLLISGLLHTGYKLFLIRAYAQGDLAQVYPLARGTAPLAARFRVSPATVWGEVSTSGAERRRSSPLRCDAEMANATRWVKARGHRHARMGTPSDERNRAYVSPIVGGTYGRPYQAR
jgi:hypothetical protein